MAKLRISLLSQDEIQHVHTTSLRILNEVGVRVSNPQVLDCLAGVGAVVDQATSTARLPEATVLRAVEQAGKQYILHGRSQERVARYGYGDQNLISSPGQYAWFDHHSGQRRDPLLKDTIAAAKLGDALSNVTIVGGMSVPVDVPEPIRDVLVTATLVRNTTKPTWCWASSRRSAAYILEIYKAVAGGKEALRRRPMVEVFLEPISIRRISLVPAPIS